jgi:MscS family membrane protein
MTLGDIQTWLTGQTFGSYFANDWIFAGLIFVMFIILAQLILFIVQRYLESFATKTKTKFDDLLLARTKRPVFYFIMAIGVHLAVSYLGFTHQYVTQTTYSLVALFFMLIISRIIDVTIETWGSHLAAKTETSIDEIILPLFHKATHIFIGLITLIWILKVWQVNITPYLAGVGISGIVLGLALQDSLKNVFGGISMILDKNFQLGDTVKLESGDIGRIQEIGLRSTKLLTYDNELIFVPNGQLANMRLQNFLRPNKKIRKTVEFSVVYGSNVEKVQKVVLAAISKIKTVHTDPKSDVIFVKMNDSGLAFRARIWSDWDEGYTAWLTATQKIYEALNKAKIGIPYPTRTVYLKK